jgi:hypothetical protein
MIAQITARFLNGPPRLYILPLLPPSPSKEKSCGYKRENQEQYQCIETLDDSTLTPIEVGIDTAREGVFLI